jgi:hypothetical protein
MATLRELKMFGMAQAVGDRAEREMRAVASRHSQCASNSSVNSSTAEAVVRRTPRSCLALESRA